MSKKLALAESISITDEILSLLDGEDFSRVGELEDKRQLLIRQAFDQSIEDIDQIKAAHLNSLNQQVVLKLGQLKKGIMQQHQQIRAGTKATNAYQNHASAR